jgi:hypothetical protein
MPWEMREIMYEAQHQLNWRATPDDLWKDELRDRAQSRIDGVPIY